VSPIFLWNFFIFELDFRLPDPTKFAKYERTQIEGCFGCCVGKSDSEFLFETRGGQLSFSALNKKQKKSDEFLNFFNHLVAYTPAVASVDPAYIAASLACHSLPPLNPALEMSNPAIKERFGPLVIEGEIPLAGLSYDSSVSIVENKGGSCCNQSEQHDYAMLATNRRIMLYNIVKHKAACCCTLFCFCCDSGKTQAVHTVTIADAQYIEGAQLFFSGEQFDLCCCGICCKQPYWSPFFGMPRGEIFIEGVNFHQNFIGMGMDSPVANRTFQVISALSQAARVDKVSAENFVEQGLVQHYAKAASFASAAVAYQSAASNFPPPSVPHSMVEVVVSNGV
jgi:hypothetical protein